MKKLSLALILLLIVISCRKDNNTCGCKDPLTDLSWLSELKNSITNCTCEVSIFQATYKKETVFYTIMSDPLCNSNANIAIADCKGTILKIYTSAAGEFSDEVSDRKLLYKCQKN